MSTHLVLKIDKPCQENWDAMTPTARGRHCAQCNKVVTDFTALSDAALIKFFKDQKGRVCGRFLAGQLNQPIAIPHQPHSRLYRMTMAMGLCVLFSQNL